MTEIAILQMPYFKKAYKKLPKNQKMAVETAIEAIKIDPLVGELKKGDLAQVYVYKFDCVNQQFLLAYEFYSTTRLLLTLGLHQNFYRDLKKSQ